MGLFSGIKKAFNVGGVKVKLTAPTMAQKLGEAVPVSVELTTKSPQKVNLVTVRLIRRQEMTAEDKVPAADQQIAELSSQEGFAINPGETKTLQFNLPLSMGSAVQEAAPNSQAAGMVGGLLKKVEAVAGAVSGGNYRYYVQATAKVEGATFGPADEQQIQILNPGEIGFGKTWSA